MNKVTKIIVPMVVLLVVGGGAFYGGTVFGKGQTKNQRTAFASANGTRVRFQTGNNFFSGSVTAKDSQTLTVKMPDGSSRIILYSPSTEVGKFVSGNNSDVSVGSDVVITGQTNSDGSITAQSIQIRPAGSNNFMRTQ